MNLLADASIPGLDDYFSSPFTITTYRSAKEIPLKLKGQDILFCRSTLKVDEHLLKDSKLRFVATASSGVDHIDKTFLSQHGIELISAKGSNASAVADYVIASLAFLQQYKDFKGTKALVIGVGEVGRRVVKRLLATKLDVYCYDPLQKSLDKNLYITELNHLDQFDLITLHPNLHEDMPFPSKNLFNDNLIQQLKPKTAIVNTSRGSIVREEDLLKTAKPLFYCTDVYQNEPQINPEIIDYSCLCTPHIAGHSIEAKLKATFMVSRALYAFYGLKTLEIKKMADNLPILPPNLSWQELALRLYNPMHESAILKNSEKDLKDAFLKGRKLHQFRHDFSSFDSSKIEPNIKAILGINNQGLNADD